MMGTLVSSAYATKQRSSRAIECRCREDVADRVIHGNVVPDHALIARFVVRHEAALAELFGEVLKLCDQPGLVGPGLVAIDSTRLTGNASPEANREFELPRARPTATHRAPQTPRLDSTADDENDGHRSAQMDDAAESALARLPSAPGASPGPPRGDALPFDRHVTAGKCRAAQPPRAGVQPPPAYINVHRAERLVQLSLDKTGT